MLSTTTRRGLDQWLVLAGIIVLTSCAPKETVQHQSQSTPPVDCAAYPPAAASPYNLPFSPGSAFEVWRTTSHYTPGNRGVGLYAIDFRTPMGTPVLAAREGLVVAARDHFPDVNGKDLEENFVFVRHTDSTVARYFHLMQGGVAVEVGQRVRQGQTLGKSGNSGESTGPHLHFDVQRCGPNLPPNYNRLPCGQTVPVTFQNTEPHRCGLEPGKVYRAE